MGIYGIFTFRPWYILLKQTLFIDDSFVKYIKIFKSNQYQIKWRIVKIAIEVVINIFLLVIYVVNVLKKSEIKVGLNVRLVNMLNCLILVTRVVRLKSKNNKRLK